MKRLVQKDDLSLWTVNVLVWAVFAAYLWRAHGRLDPFQHAIGRDFVNFWTAGRLLGEGRIQDVFRPELFADALHRLFHPGLQLHFWSYPPPALFLVAPLARLDYFPALFVWSLVGIVALTFAVRAVLADPRDQWLLLLSPAVAVNLAMGQNGAFTAALLLGGFAVMRTRPILAGFLFGLLVFKPQLGLLLPLVVLAEGRWRTFVAAGATATAAAGLSALVFGLEAWRGFLGPTLTMQTRMMTEGEGPFLWMMPSAFAAARLHDLAHPLLAQLPFAVLAVLLVWRTWRSQADYRLKVAAALLGTLVATPQAFNYDMIPALAAALLLFRLDTPAARFVAICLWALPLFVIPFNALGATIAPLVTALALAQLQRAATEQAAPAAVATA